MCVPRGECDDGVVRTQYENGYDKIEEVNFSVSSQSLRFERQMKRFNRLGRKLRNKERVQVPPPLRPAAPSDEESPNAADSPEVSQSDEIPSDGARSEEASASPASEDTSASSGESSSEEAPSEGDQSEEAPSYPNGKMSIRQLDKWFSRMVNNEEKLYTVAGEEEGEEEIIKINTGTQTVLLVEWLEVVKYKLMYITASKKFNFKKIHRCYKFQRYMIKKKVEADLLRRFSKKVGDPSQTNMMVALHSYQD